MNEFQTNPQLKKFNVLLIGDSCQDEYQYGAVHRISPEAPVPVFNFLHTEEKPGMAFNVRSNLESIGVNVTLLTSSPSRKIRLVDIKTKQQLLRIDQDHYCKEPLQFETAIPSVYDAVIVSDYEKGYITYELLEELPSLFNGPIYVDTKKTDLARLKNCIIKINEQERNMCTSVPESERLIVTLGSMGVYYDGEIYKGEAVEVADVCGAGDTFLAALVFHHLNTGNMRTAIEYANKAAAVTVQHFGTYAPEIGEYL